MADFALIGAAGFVAVRHMRAIADTGNQLVAAFDPKDSVGVIDQHFPDAHFFVEFERFDRHVDKLRRRANTGRLRERSARRTIFTTRTSASGCAAAPTRSARSRWCSIPGTSTDSRRSSAIPDGACTPSCNCGCIPRSSRCANRSPRRERTSAKHEVDLTYITSRGRWYHVSWKGDDEKSGGIATNIGVHFFDMLQWVSGP